MPHVSRIPGHVPLSPSPLMRRKPKVSMQSDALGEPETPAARTTQSAAAAPSSTLSPNTRLNNMVHHGTVSMGGAAGGAVASITTLKSDLVMVQAEIDAVTRNGSGAMELQSTLARFGASSDERTNIETCNTLMSLILVKLNELSRLHCSALSTAPRQSRVGDILAFFRSQHQPHSSAAAAQQSYVAAALHTPTPAARGASQSPGATPQTFRSEPAEATADPMLVPAADEPHAHPAAPNPDIESRPAERPTAARATGHDSPIPILDSRTSSPLGDLPPQDGALVDSPPDSPRVTTYDSTLTNANARDISLTTQVAGLRRQLATFKYMEKALYVVDEFDSTMRHITMSDALRTAGVDLKELLANARIELPPHTFTKTGAFRPAPGATAVSTSGGGRQAAVSFKGVNAGDSSAGDSAIPVDGASDAGDAASVQGAAASPAAASGGSGEPLATAGLRSLVAFQNAVISLLTSELRTAKDGAHDSPRRGANDGPSGQETHVLQARVQRLEAALKIRNEQIASERQLHMVRHERAANALFAERTRSATPGFGDQERPVSVLSESAASRPLSRVLMQNHPVEAPEPVAHGSFTLRGSTAGQVAYGRPATRGGVSGLALPPVGGPSASAPPTAAAGQRASTPLLATRHADVPGSTETQYRRRIAQQDSIIRDLQRRVQQQDGTDL